MSGRKHWNVAELRGLLDNVSPTLQRGFTGDTFGMPVRVPQRGEWYHANVD